MLGHQEAVVLLDGSSEELERHDEKDDTNA